MQNSNCYKDTMVKDAEHHISCILRGSFLEGKIDAGTSYDAHQEFTVNEV